MPGDQTAKVFRLAGSLEATAEKPSHRPKNAEKKIVFEVQIFLRFAVPPGEYADDQAVEHKGGVLSLVEGGGAAGLD